MPDLCAGQRVSGSRVRAAAGGRNLPWRDVPGTSDTCDRGHGRRERRTLKVTAVAAGLAFPHATQGIQIVRRRRSLTSSRWSTETVYAITSLTPAQASPTQLAAALRGHWAIEDRLHWVRDVTYGADLAQVRTASGSPRHGHPASNLAITILRLAGATSIAALRHHSRPGRPLHTITTT
jgi:Transposase DDE domain